MIPSSGQLPGFSRIVKVRESVVGQNLSIWESSDHKHHTPGAGPTAELVGLLTREKEEDRTEITRSEVSIK